MQKNLHMVTRRRPASPSTLSKRERQVMDLIYQRGEASAADVFEALADAASYNAVRSTLTILEQKGHLKKREEARKYVYRPAVAPEKARGSRLAELLKTLFSGSPTQLVSTLLDEERPSDEELAQIEKMVRAARRKA
ncbi:MAG TPA: BlaI/MecI/CopY family transcriptional regulator [Thermoanaerobaculia bacterium]